ncbi:MAG: ferritin-like domain-containing protein, partial [Acidobacteriota bacterium]
MRRRFFGSTVPAMPASGSEDSRITASFSEVASSPPVPMHDPPLEPRDEAVFLLTAAAEIEHALMVQYLFAAYSLRVSAHANLPKLQGRLLQIAREEMGHLITVQNLLHLVGGPLNFNREHSPYASEIYPFRFKLEPVSLDSLAKYVVAESPDPLPDDFSDAERNLYEQEILPSARRSNDGEKVNHVGPIFQRLETIFREELKDEDFRLDTQPFQATYDDWGYEPKTKDIGSALIVETISGLSASAVRDAAAAAIRNIGQQGEGFDPPPGSSTDPESHFERFLLSYLEFKTLKASGAQLTWPLAENPNTSSPPQAPISPAKMAEAIAESHAGKGRITDPRARNWAHLFNLRYRLLLAYLSHFLRLDQQRYTDSGDRTPRGLLLIWTFNEMRRLKKLAEKLVQLPKDKREDETQPFPPDALNAGPPFELPYTLNLP